MPPGPLVPAGRFGRTRAVLLALLKGQLRAQFYSDVFRFGDRPDATRQVAAGYICLATTLAWTLGVIGTLAAYPGRPEAYLLAAVNAVASYLGFLRIRRHQDPRRIVDWLMFLYLGTVVVLQYRQAGHVAPAVVTMPIVAAMAALYQRPSLRPATLVVGLLVLVFCVLSVLGFIGQEIEMRPQARSVMMLLTLAITTASLGGIAWISVLSRDYALAQLTLANDTIVESTTRARVALEAARVGLWDVPNADARRFNVSESFVAVTGYTGQEFDAIFGRLEQFVHPEDVSSLRDAFAAGRQQMARIRVDFRLLTKGRGYRWFSARARYLANPDGTTRISGSLQDINVIKVAEEALRTGRDQARAANKAKSDFIAVMSHEVRTPLNAILGSAQVLRRGTHDQESAEMIALIDDAGRGLLAIVNDLLDVSRIDAGKLEITPAPADLTALVRRTVEFWGPQARDKGLSLNVDCYDAGNLPLLMLDAGRLRQIVGNLVSNAIKFTNTGSVTAHVSGSETADGHIEIVVSVIDTGPGVPDAVAEAIFAPFEQAPGDASKGGAGLGLFISRRLARMMGGDLTLEPARRNGAHFRLTLAAKPADPAATVAVEVDPLDTSGHALKILCVDDNEKNRRIVELLLGKLGFDVTLCASGGEALDICAIQSFDLLLMDIVMPDMDGMETLRRLRADGDSLNRATPAIALTAKLSPDDIASYRGAGFDGVAAKPISIADVATEIARLMSARAMARS